MSTTTSSRETQSETAVRHVASAMLQRQQAAAILAALQLVVEGAAGMMQFAIAQIEHDRTSSWTKNAKPR